jgi:hypothetical protein
MRETAAVLCFFFAFALLHGASPTRRSLWPSKLRARLAAFLRAGALVAIAVGVASWSRAESATAAWLVALSALSVAAPTFVLLVPLFPRTLWGLALASPLFIAALLVLGGSRG